MQRQGGKVVTTTVGRHPDRLLGKAAAPERNARLLAAEIAVRVRRVERVNVARREARAAAHTVGRSCEPGSNAGWPTTGSAPRATLGPTPKEDRLPLADGGQSLPCL